jgi:CBS domain-containing protein
VPIGATTAAVRALAPSTMPVPVLGRGGVLLGAVSPVATEIDPRTPVEQIMVTAPGTVRPDLRVADVARRLADDHLDHVFVTTVAGELIGIVIADQLHI